MSPWIWDHIKAYIIICLSFKSLLCFKVPPKLNASDAPVREQKYYLKTFETKITSKAIALVYSFATQNDNITDILPDPSKIYDFKDCIVKNPDLQSFFLATTLSTFQATTRPTDNVQFVLNHYYKKWRICLNLSIKGYLNPPSDQLQHHLTMI